MLNVIEIVLPVFIVIGLGYGIRQAGLVDKNFFVQVNGLVFYVCLPLLLFYKIGNCSAAPHLRPFRASRVAQVRFESLNERIWSRSEQLQSEVVQISSTHLNSYQNRNCRFFNQF